EVVIDSVDLTRLEIDKDGNFNLAKLLKPSPPAPAKPLPEISGHILIKSITGTFTSPNIGKPLKIRPGSSLEASLASINSPITNKITLNLQSGDNPPGQIALDGKVSLIQNGLVDMEHF